jgi:hypothetical protein
MEHLKRTNLKVVWAEFLSLNQSVFVMNINEWNRQAHPH